MDPDATMPPLGETGRDRLVALGKGAIGAIPYAGSILAEIVTQFIPVQRMERLEEYCRRLEERLSRLEAGDLNERMKDPERIDLFEEGAIQSARASSAERRAYIARIVAEGLTGDQQAAIDARRILKLLAEVDDDQIVILTSHLSRHLHDEKFYERHRSVLESVGAHMGSDPDEVRRETMYELARADLVRLGLLQTQYRQVKKGEIPEFDPRTGTMKGGRRTLSPLGHLLLVHLGIADAEEF